MHVEQGVGIHHQPFAKVADFLGQPHLVLLLDRAPAHLKAGIVGHFFQAAQLVQINDPAAANSLGNERGQPGVALQEPAALGNAIGLIIKTAGKEFMEPFEDAFLQQIGVQSCHPVYRVAANDGQMGHAHLFHWSLGNNGQVAQSLLIALAPHRHLFQKAAIDLVDNFQVARQDIAQQLHRPGFQGLGHEGVISVAKGPHANVPGLCPAQPLLVDQQPHEFRDGDGGMGVVELNRDLVAETVKTGMFFLVTPQNILEGGGHEKILLLEPQFLALANIVGRIEQFGNGLHLHLLVHGLNIVAAVEGGKVQFAGGTGGPQPHVDDVIVVVAGHQHVAGHGHDGFGIHPLGVIDALLVNGSPNPAVKINRIKILGPFELPRRAVAQPVVRAFHLKTVQQALVKQAELVTYAVAIGRDLQGGQRVHETGGQPPQAAVAQGRVFLLLAHCFQVMTKLLQHLGRLVHHVKIGNGIAQGAAHQKFQGEVVDPLLPHVVIVLLGLDPFFHEQGAQGIGKGLVQGTIGTTAGVAAKETQKIMGNRLFEPTEVKCGGRGAVGSYGRGLSGFTHSGLHLALGLGKPNGNSTLNS